MNEVAHIPSSILTCYVDGKETGILKVSDEKIVLRFPKACEKEEYCLEIRYFLFEENCYRALSLGECPKTAERKKAYHYEYEFEIGNRTAEYKQMIQKVIWQYYNYICSKNESFDNEFSKKLVGYPFEQDEVFAGSYEEWKKENIENNHVLDVCQIVKKYKMDFAVSLENDSNYQSYLLDSWQEQEMHTAVGQADCLYIGNQFCHNLFPDGETLLQLMEKAYREQKKIVIVTTYLRDSQIEEKKADIERLAQWCQTHACEIELVINDYGMLPLLTEYQAYFKITLGTLLNKWRKDPRLFYKKGITEHLELLKKNQQNQDLMKIFRMDFHISRVEYENYGYEMESVSGNKSIHYPIYQTNTSQYCPLYALVKYRNREKQSLVTECPKYCRDSFLAYPGHLQMAGYYNSLFALHAWKSDEIEEKLRQRKMEGYDRLVWNLML